MTEVKEVTSHSDMEEIFSLFDVSIDPPNEQNVYMPGETILGSVQISEKENAKIDGFVVSLVGEYYTITGDIETCHTFSSEIATLDLKGAGEGLSEIPFSLILKPDSPSSIATSLGGIKYKIVGSLIVVDTHLMKYEKDVYLSVIAPKQIEIDEKILRKKDMKYFKNEVSRVERGSVLPGKQQVWLAERFLVPSLPPTTSDAFFDVSYKFVMNIQKSSSKTLKIKIPVTIGNIMGLELPKSWKEQGGIELGSYGEPQTMKVLTLPLYVTYCF